VGIAPLDDPTHAIGGVTPPRDDAACIALVELFGSDALCVRSPQDDMVCSGPQETMVMVTLALDFPPHTVRRARTLTRSDRSGLASGDCVTG